MRVKKILIALTAVLVCATFAVNVRASEWNKRTVVTFKQAVEIPGQVLPAGTYTMELLQNVRNVVLFYNADHSQLVGTVFAIHKYRPKATDETVMTFAERQGNAPSALKVWYYPGESLGREFVYANAEVIHGCCGSSEH